MQLVRRTARGSTLTEAGLRAADDAVLGLVGEARPCGIERRGLGRAIDHGGREIGFRLHEPHTDPAEKAVGFV